MKIKLVDVDVMKIMPRWDECKIHGNHYAPITRVALDNYISLYTVRVPNRKGDRLVYLRDYSGTYMFYVPYGEDIWSEFSIEYKLTDIEDSILGLDEGYADIVAANIRDRFDTYGFFVDSDIIQEFCYTVIAPEYTMDEIKDMLLKEELNK